MERTERDGQRECGFGREVPDHLSDGRESGRETSLGMSCQSNRVKCSAPLTPSHQVRFVPKAFRLIPFASSCM